MRLEAVLFVIVWAPWWKLPDPERKTDSPRS